jgi:hypothetical protein
LLQIEKGALLGWLRRYPSVPSVGANCPYGIFSAKLAIMLHDLAHQLFDHLLADSTILAAS